MEPYMLNFFFYLRSIWISLAILLFIATTASAGSASLNGFSLSCPGTTSEGASLTCTLTNDNATSKPWPVVAVLHLSSDEASMALVRGEPLDVSLNGGTSGGLEWFGGVLIGYSRFDLSGNAVVNGSRTFNVTIHDDDDYERAERFYVALGPDRSKGIGFFMTIKPLLSLLRATLEAVMLHSAA